MENNDIFKEILGDDLDPNAQGQASPDVNQQGKSPETNQPQGQEVSDEDLLLLADMGLSDKELADKSPEEILKLIQEHKEKQQQQLPSIPIISEDIAKEVGGILKSFVGKPITEIAKALNEQNSYIGKLQSKIQQLEKALSEKPQPSPQDNPPKKDILGADLEKMVEEVLRKKIPTLDRLAEVSIEEQQKEILSTLEKQLGKDPMPIIKEFGADLTDEDIAMYERNPKRFIRDVTQYAKAKELEQELLTLKKQTEREKKLEALKRTREILGKAKVSAGKPAPEPPEDDDETLLSVKEILSKTD